MDEAFVHYILQGIAEGFRVGFNCRHHSLIFCKRNMSATQLPQVVSDYLLEELALNRVTQIPAVTAQAVGIQCSPFGVIPKKNKPGKLRLIVDLSSPAEHSVNDAIGKECSFYTSVDDVAEAILRMGKGALLAKNGQSIPRTALY